MIFIERSIPGVANVKCINFYSQLRQIAKAQQADLNSGRGRQHQATHSTSVVVALQSRLASMTSDFKQVKLNMWPTVVGSIPKVLK